MSRPRKLHLVEQIRLNTQIRCAKEAIELFKFAAENPERAREILASTSPPEWHDQHRGLRLVKPVDPISTTSRDLGQPAQREQALPAESVRELGAMIFGLRHGATDPEGARVLLAKLELLARQGHEPGSPGDPQGAA